MRSIRVFMMSLPRKLGRLMLFSLCIGLSVASVTVVHASADIAFESINGELDSTVFDGVELKSSTLSLTSARKAAAALAAEADSRFSPLSVAEAVSKTDDSLTVYGVGQSAQNIFSVGLKCGRFIDFRDTDAAQRVCVISEQTARAKFSRIDCIGSPLELEVGSQSLTLRVVGVYASGRYVERIAGMSEARVYVPYTLLQELMGEDYSEDYMVCDSPALPKALGQAAQSSALVGMAVTDMSQQRQGINEVFTTVSLVLTIVTGVSVVVAAVSLLIMMLLNVRDSVHEIGLKKALGASGAAIAAEYIAESATVAVLGVLLGTTVYAAFCGVMLVLGHTVDFDFAYLAFVAAVAVALSVVSGLLPAVKAARLRPIDAMRRV